MMDVSAALGDGVDRMVSRLAEPASSDLARRLTSLADLSPPEREVVAAAAATTTRQAVWRHVSRVVVLEFHAARLRGELTADDPDGRWAEWVARLASPGSWEALARPYPTLLRRVRTLTANRCRAMLVCAERFGRDRAQLSALLGSEPGELTAVTPGVGDSHHGGQAVAVMHCVAGSVVYKPRPVGVDAALGGLLPQLLPEETPATRIRVPAVLPNEDHHGGYGWAEHVAHRYCSGEPELQTFYRNLGHWLAVLRLLGGSDLHAENLVAAGPVPVVVDCETLFTPHRTKAESGYGAAVDLAVDRIDQSVLRIGLLPGRGAVLGWRGVDPSAAGFLPGQQPVIRAPAIEGLGTDQPRVGTAPALPPAQANHPSPEPELNRYWEHVADGFTALSEHLHALDRSGKLAPLLAEFSDCRIRVVVRNTASYTELARMLWHPSSLHQPEAAAQRARELLLRQAANAPLAPADPQIIDAEVAELCDGDVPVFQTTPSSGECAGPRGTRWGMAEDLVGAALRRWRGADPAVDRQVVQAALVSAYLNDGQLPQGGAPAAARAGSGDPERLRRRHAALILQQIRDSALRGDDGTATWVAPTLDATGWAVRPMPPDLYSGGAGIAILLASYLQEVTAGRADEVPGLVDLLSGVLDTLRRFEDQHAADRAAANEAGIRTRPDAPGGYLGLGSRIWSWLLLHRLGAVAAHEAISRAEALADQLPAAVAADTAHDLLGGAAGAIVPLLRLAEHTGRTHWTEVARTVGDRLRSAAVRDDAGVRWPSAAYPNGLGGLSHGTAGIGWALSRLALATGDAGFRELAAAAAAWDESLYDPHRRGWRDARTPDQQQLAVTWCHGAVGIGLAAADLLGCGDQRGADVLRRAVEATRPDTAFSNHTLCHGALSAWELWDRAASAGLAPTELDRDAATRRILTDLAASGPVAGPSREVSLPGLLAGLGGIAYQLLRMHPDSNLPSVLLPDPGPVVCGRH